MTPTDMHEIYQQLSKLKELLTYVDKTLSDKFDKNIVLFFVETKAVNHCSHEYWYYGIERNYFEYMAAKLHLFFAANKQIVTKYANVGYSWNVNEELYKWLSNHTRRLTTHNLPDKCKSTLSKRFDGQWHNGGLPDYYYHMYMIKDNKKIHFNCSKHNKDNFPDKNYVYFEYNWNPFFICLTPILDNLNRKNKSLFTTPSVDIDQQVLIFLFICFIAVCIAFNFYININ